MTFISFLYFFYEFFAIFRICSATVRGNSRTAVPEIIKPVFVKTCPKRSFSMTEYERFGLVFTKTRVYKFGHWSPCNCWRTYCWCNSAVSCVTATVGDGDNHVASAIADVLAAVACVPADFFCPYCCWLQLLVSLLLLASTCWHSCCCWRYCNSKLRDGKAEH